jgi:hypothetical protein
VRQPAIESCGATRSSTPAARSVTAAVATALFATAAATTAAPAATLAAGPTNPPHASACFHRRTVRSTVCPCFCIPEPVIVRVEAGVPRLLWGLTPMPFTLPAASCFEPSSQQERGCRGVSPPSLKAHDGSIERVVVHRHPLPLLLDCSQLGRVCTASKMRGMIGGEGR